MNPFPVKRPSEIEPQGKEGLWLVEELWADQAVGIVGGEPKCCKSFLALDLALSVASGAPCLRRFRPAQRGPVVLFAAEDSPHLVRRRLEGIARAARVSFEDLDIHLITAPQIRLDATEDRERLDETLASIQPKLLVLDPFVRLHRIDENVVAEVAPLLGYLRGLQRRHHTAVALVHHARKGAAHARAGQALRGSSELHAWGDSNLYLRRKADRLILSVEHRAAPSLEGLALELKATGQALALHLAGSNPQAASPSPASAMISERIESLLRSSSGPLAQREIRSACRIRSTTLSKALKELSAQGRVHKSPEGYTLP